MVLEFFAGFSFFNGGMEGAAMNAVIWFLFVYSTARAYEEKPFEHVLNVLLPAITLSFILIFFGIPDLLIGIVIICAVLITIKHYDKLNMHKFIVLFLKILAILFVNNIFGHEIGWIMLWFLIGWNFVEAELTVRIRKSKEKKAKTEKKE